jgi:mono/diheme cytochrome c family protein
MPAVLEVHEDFSEIGASRPFLRRDPRVRFRLNNQNTKPGGRSMTRAAPLLPHRLLHVLFILLVTAHAASAQGAEQQLLGLRLFNQSCRVCHTKPTLLSGMYGPALSMNTLGGNAETIHAFISNGTARMPGFKYNFTPAQIDAIVAYIKTIPVPAQAAPAPAKAINSPGAD